MSTYIHGIAASQNIDSSGERIIIEGMDISSLPVDGVLNYEHDAATTADGKKVTLKTPQNTVGKILKAKKIFSEADCEDEHQTYFWQKVQVPYVYIMGELFDDYTESAKDLAGKLRYDADRKDKQERNIVNFSVEGQYIARNGMDVIRSIARKVTITVGPCNKVAVAELVAAPGQQAKDDIDAIFKTEGAVEIRMISGTKKAELETMAKKDPEQSAKILGIDSLKKGDLNMAEDKAKGVLGLNKAAEPATQPRPQYLKIVPGKGGAKIGTTKSGKAVTSHGLVHEYKDFSMQDHRDAAEAHGHAASKAGHHKLAQHHQQKAQLHQSKANSLLDREARMKKAMEAGSGMAAPGNLVQGAALAKEQIANKPNNGFGAIIHKPAPAPKPGFGKIIRKSEGLKKAEELYKAWDKREAFETFMAKRMPHLHKGEIEALGKAVALQKTLKFGSAEDQAKLAADNAERAKNPPKKAAPHKKAPEIKAPMHGEVSHTTPYGNSGKHETVHLKSGHEVGGAPKGKFKSGDKVHVKPHLMGTVLIDHHKE